MVSRGREMNDWFSKCGANCSRCPAYRENAATVEARQRCSDGWHTYLGVRLNPDRCYCDGCQTPDDQDPVLVYGKYGCRIRRCAVFNGAPTCAHCSAYPCQAVRNQFSFDSGSRERLAARLGAPISDEDYATFIQPYELHAHLERIRASLSPQDMVEMTPVSVISRTIPFPDDLPFSQEETSALEALHRILVEVGCVEHIPHVEQKGLKERRRHVLKILWTFGLLGEPDGEKLVVDGQIYLAQKIQSSYERLQDYFAVLEEVGVRCEHVPLVEKGWLTPGGALRGAGWLMTLSFDDDVGGVSAAGALQTYAARLHRAYGERAFRYFSKADMRVLGAG
jgi:hypothetical protein